MLIKQGSLKIFYTMSALFIFGLFFSGCAKKMPPPVLEEARASYQAARTNPAVIQHAPLELEKAELALKKAEELFEEDAEASKIEHQAYLAKQHAAIAQEMSDRVLAQQAIDRAGEMRNKILIEARGAEAEYARQQAQKARGEATTAQEEATTAQERAAKLEAELADLQAVKAERGMVVTLGEVVFDVDKADLNPGGMRTVRQLATFLQKYPSRKVMIEGFTDSTGAADYNQALSERRARAVRTALMDMGIEQSRIETRGYGEDFPVASNETTAGRQLNRRVEIIISDHEGTIQERRS